MTKEILCVLAAGGLSLATFAADYEYVPTGEAPHCWNTLGNWLVGTDPAQGLPTSADAVYVGLPALSLESPMTIPDGCAATAKTLNFGATAGGQEFNTPIMLKQEAGSSLTVDTFYAAAVKRSYFWEIDEGASASVRTLDVGHSVGTVFSVTNRGTADIAYPNIGWLGGTNVFENFGTLRVTDQMRVARSSNSTRYPCYAVLNVHPGSELRFPKCTGNNTIQVYVGDDGIGIMNVKGTVVSEAPRRIFIGSGTCSATTFDHSVGIVEVSGNGSIATNGIVNHNMNISVASARKSEGTLRILDNGIVRFKGVNTTDAPTFGGGVDSVAYLTMSNNALYHVTANAGVDFAAGENSTAYLNLADNAQCLSGYIVNLGMGVNAKVHADFSGSAILRSPNLLNIASGESSSATIRIRENAEFQSSYSTKVAQGSGSSADIILAGGKIGVRPIAPNNVLMLGTDESCGRISGYGTLGSYQYSPGSSYYLQLELNGQIVSDGGGESRTLDAGLFREVNTEIYALPGHGNWCGTNGWYAINGGRLVMPQYLAVSNDIWCVGDYNQAGEPGFVGSFRVAFAAKPTSSYLHASLYAAAHADVPAGLPTEGKHMCVEDIWCLGYGDGRTAADPTSAVDFGSADITFRFGARSVKPGRTYTVAAWRYDVETSQWVKVSSAEYDPANPTVVFRNVTPVDDGATKWNMGWFAVTLEKDPGLMILLR